MVIVDILKSFIFYIRCRLSRLLTTLCLHNKFYYFCKDDDRLEYKIVILTFPRNLVASAPRDRVARLNKFGQFALLCHSPPLLNYNVTS